MWRPENWENPWRSFEWGDGEIYQWTEAKIHEQYEAGADAMLEALVESDSSIEVFRNSISLPGFLTDTVEYLCSLGNGKWVFIPNEE